MQEVKSNIEFTSNYENIRDCDIFIVTVLTPIDSENRPDLTPLVQASKIVGGVLEKDDLVIYESIVYPGVTKDICVPELEKSSGLVFNKIFTVVILQKINPGDKEHTVTNILKVTSGQHLKLQNY